MKKRPRLGLAIGGGAAYGLSAIGVLKVLEENEIPVDVISGTSIGSVIGALYASGMKSFRIEDELFSTEWKELLDFVLPEKGLVSGKKIENYIRDLIKNKTFEQLETPLYITAVDIEKGQEVIFNKGDVASAVRASISIPGVFTPVRMGGMVLVDGGVMDPIPTGVLKKHCDVIIAIDFRKEIKPYSYVSAEKEEGEFLKIIEHDFIETEVKYFKESLKHGKLRVPVPFRWFLSPKYISNLITKRGTYTSQSNILGITKKSYHIMFNELANLSLQIHKPDILIKPDLSKMNWLEFDKGEYAMKQGEIATKEQINKILKILKR